jgi:hypothetical protein
MNKAKLTLAAAAVLVGSALATDAASAMPNGLPSATLAQDSAQDLAQDSAAQNVRWVCSPYRCWWRPNWYRSYAFYGPRLRWRHRHWW